MNREEDNKERVFFVMKTTRRLIAALLAAGTVLTGGGRDTRPTTRHASSGRAPPESIRATGRRACGASRRWCACALAATFTGAVGLVPASAEPAAPPVDSTAATSGSTFDPGNIISDAVFYNTASMTTEQIRDFITIQARGATHPGA